MASVIFTTYHLYLSTYQIYWFNNESKLKIGTHKRAGFVMFKYIYFDNCFPIVGGNENL